MSDDLSTKELLESERQFFNLVQKESFTEEYSSGLKSISHFKDLSGTMHVKTKLTERKDCENFKTPILLSNKHKWVELYIQQRHLELLHCGLNTLLMELRENFWIINDGKKKTVRKVTEKCIRCRRHTAKTMKTIPVALSEDRIRDASVFEICDIDLAGPPVLKERVKNWILLYTCAVAVHLELVESVN
ncbi:uncharacterized protein LOC118203320 [Stegodyphus dumicola]|uniref:uncharacterized protein LOC118203320 n=1 Tax=Stegodyphus dumicola TaxID=202533 RepID=UPI0015ABA686|nr:uncharacterized protein LOC118203320 [Stegodyphus dumicola]